MEQIFITDKGDVATVQFTRDGYANALVVNRHGEMAKIRTVLDPEDATANVYYIITELVAPSVDPAFCGDQFLNDPTLNGFLGIETGNGEKLFKQIPTFADLKRKAKENIQLKKIHV